MTYKNLFEQLKERGLNGVELIVSDAHSGLIKAIEESFPGASLERLKERYEKQYPKAMEVLENGLEDSLSYYDFPSLDARKSVQII